MAELHAAMSSSAIPNMVWLGLVWTCLGTFPRSGDALTCVTLQRQAWPFDRRLPVAVVRCGGCAVWSAGHDERFQRVPVCSDAHALESRRAPCPWQYLHTSTRHRCWRAVAY